MNYRIENVQDNFFLFDASSSNGTMLFLSKPLELDWNKTVHVKIGRTILTLKSKKRWKWSGGNSEQNGNELEYGSTVGSPPPVAASGVFASTPTNQAISASATSPPAHARSSSSNSQIRAAHRSFPNRFEPSGSGVLNDPTSELVSSPYSLRDVLGRSYPSAGSRQGFHELEDRDLPSPPAGLGNQIESMRLSDLVEEEPMLATANNANRREAQEPLFLAHDRRHNLLRTGSSGPVHFDVDEERHLQQQQQEATLFEIADSLADIDLAASGPTGVGTPIVVDGDSAVHGNRD